MAFHRPGPAMFDAMNLLRLTGLALLSACAEPAAAQTPPAIHDIAPPVVTAPRTETPAPGSGILHLSATLTADTPVVRSGVQWRIFDDKAAPDGSHRLMTESGDAMPALSLPDGRYIVHATYGFASTMKRLDVADHVTSERFSLNAGAIEVGGVLGDVPIAPDKLSLSIFVPEHGNPEARLVDRKSVV